MTLEGLQLDGVVKRFGEHVVVNAASLNVGNGEIVALLGPSGCGKTTTLRLIAGFEKPDGGSIAIAGHSVIGQPPFRRQIGLVFQDYALFPHMTVAQNVDYGMRQHSVPATEREERRTRLLRLVRLEGLEHRRPSTLSGGQQQRVALARALAISPRLLLLDEPLSNLDAKLREVLRQELREILQSVHMTTLVVTHDQQEAIALADRIALMNSGRIVQIGTGREIYEEPATRFVAEFIGQSFWFTGKVGPGTDGRSQFLCDDGNAFVATAPQRSVGVRGLSIRPEHVHLTPRSTDHNRIPAEVVLVEFFGAELMVHCRLTRGGRIIAIPIRSDDPDIPAPGTIIELGVAPERCRVVDDDFPKVGDTSRPEPYRLP
jgi:putative spermidine/putrescine transport system ATP-binding protein